MQKPSAVELYNKGFEHRYNGGDQTDRPRNMTEHQIAAWLDGWSAGWADYEREFARLGVAV